MNKTKVCVVTGSRAEYGLLHCVMKSISGDDFFDLSVVVTGMHLSPEFGHTYRVIEEDGFKIDAKIEMLLSSDTPVGITKSIGLGTIGFAEVFDRIRPDLLILLGDRFEIFAAAQAAMIAKIPIAHIFGGDSTEGAFDESIRHSITKMSHIHFVTNEAAARRVRQMGEHPDRIFNVGSPGIDRIKSLKLLKKDELEKILEFKLNIKNLLITYHPVTLDRDSSTGQFKIVLDALNCLGPDVGLIITYPNADTEGRELIRMIDEYVNINKNAKAYKSLGQLAYYSAIASVDAVVGNSSSGLYEVPSFNKPTVNIGDRQKGRVLAESVVCSPVEKKSIVSSIRKAFSMDCTKVRNPYGDGDSAGRIIKTIKRLIPDDNLIKKHFYDLC